jgi:hypothetical protein
VPDRTIEAARELLDDSLHELRAAVEGCPVDRLNRRPAGEGTNGLAVLVTHALGSTLSWLSLATGARLPERDRPSEFRVVVDDAPGFLAWFDEKAARCEALLDPARPFDPAALGVPDWRYDEHDVEDPAPVTSAWALLHALAHLREHVGHAQLTRQVVDG